MPTSIRYLPLLLALAAPPVSAQTVRVYVTNSAGDSIHVIDPATNKVVQEIGRASCRKECRSRWSPYH